MKPLGSWVPEVFLSYRRDDAKVAGDLVTALRNEGIDVWWDRDIPPSASWEATIERALEDAKAVVVCWSPASVTSENVRAEARHARDLGRLVQLLVQPCKPPLFFSETQGLDLSGWSGDPLDPRFRSLVEAIRALNGNEASAAGVGQGARPRAQAGRPDPPAGVAAAAWVKARSHPLGLAVVGLLIVVAAVWAIFGSELRPGSRDRIPVVVRALAASGNGDRTEAALATGITDQLIVRLRRIPELRIATAEPDGSAPSKDFANAYTVDGNIRSNGDLLQVALRLSDPKGEILWSQSVDKTMSDLFDMQEDIASAIAGALSVSFDVGANSAGHGGTDNPEAYTAYMQFWAHITDSDQDVPLRHLERAVALDPDFGKALTGLVINYGTRAGRGGPREQTEELLARMDRISARALAAHPDSWVGHAARGWYLLSRRDVVAADTHMRRAAELDPGNDVELLQDLATFSMQLGRTKKAISIRQGKELIDPIYRNDSWKVFDLMMLGRYQDSIDLYQRLERRGQSNLQAFVYWTFISYLLLDREADAIEFSRERNTPFGAQLRAFEADKGLGAMSLPELRRWADERYRDNLYELQGLANFAGLDGDEQLAVDLVRVTLERSTGFAFLFMWNPALAEARKTDAFEQLVTDFGLVKAWRASGDWGDYCRPVDAQQIACR